MWQLKFITAWKSKLLILRLSVLWPYSFDFDCFFPDLWQRHDRRWPERRSAADDFPPERPADQSSGEALRAERAQALQTDDVLITAAWRLKRSQRWKISSVWREQESLGVVRSHLKPHLIPPLEDFIPSYEENGFRSSDGVKINGREFVSNTHSSCLYVMLLCYLKDM